MRFFHISDLHIGKRLHGYDLKEDQIFILNQIVERVQEYKPEAVIIAGDIYDKTAPSGEAVKIFNDFLTALSKVTPAVSIMIISGNHDSPERMDYASGILDRHQVHIAGIPSKEHVKKVVLTDEYGNVNFYLLPFIKPAYVREEQEELTGYQEAVKKVLAREPINTQERNVLVSHQFFTGGEGETIRSDSETAVTVGNIDNVHIETVADFDYVALGHIHRPQWVGKKTIRYCGSPLAYSVSEAKQKKSITLVTMEEKKNKENDIEIEEIPLEPLYKLREEKGTLKQVLENATQENRNDYVSITLTDEVEPYQKKEQLEDVYNRILEIKIQNTRTQSIFKEMEQIETEMEPFEIFSQFFQEMQGRKMEEDEFLVAKKVMDELL